MFTVVLPARQWFAGSVSSLHREIQPRAVVTRLISSLFWIALYVGSARIVGVGSFAADPATGVSLPTIDLPAGVAVAAILTMGYSAWPVIAVAVLLTNLASPLPLAYVLLLTIGLVTQALAGKHLIERALGKSSMDLSQGLFFFVSVIRGAIVCAVIGATVQAGLWCLSGIAAWENYIWLWVSLWLSGALGMLFVTMLIAGKGDEAALEVSSPQSRTIEAGLLGVCLVGAAASLFRVQPFAHDGFHLYLFIPIMVWAAFRFGVRGAAFAILAILAPAACGSGVGGTLFAAHRLGSVQVQCLVVVLGGTTLALAAAVESFRRVEADQQRAQRRLRQQVDRQSVELRSSNLSLLGQMAERLRIEDELRDSQARYQELFENANDIVYTHDLTGRFLSINKAGERITGYHRDELLGQGIDCLLPPEHLERARDMIRRKVQGHVPTVYELEILRKDGERVPLEVSTRIICQEGQAIAVQGIARDISERKKAEEQRRALEAKIQYAQRLESMTNLAEGIAHDFNNLLTRIVANVGVAALDLPEDSTVHSSLKRIEIAAEHASELVDQMFAYAGKGHRRIETLHLAAVVESMSSLLESVVAKGTTLVYDLGTETEAVAADTTQLRQIVMNLVLNASDALPDEGGSIEIRTGVLTLAEGEMENWPGPRGIAGGPLEPGRYVWLEIADSGRGIEPADLARVFDPFFTTKASGRGLGLAAVLGIVRAHHGGIRITSAPGKGTTFQVLLPVQNEQSPDGHAEITHRAVPVSS